VISESASAHIVIVGLGVTGVSCARYLASRDESFVVMDSRQHPPGLAEIENIDKLEALVLGRFDQHILLSAKEVWLSPGIPLTHPAIAVLAGKVPVRGDVDVFSEQAKAPVVAITGSNGKSTVTTMVGEMAKACGLNVAVGGNLGTPVLDLLDDQVDLYVVELSSFQLETTHTLGAAAATILNVSQDHMDRYSSLSAYSQAKLRIFHNCQHMILNADDKAACPAHDETEQVTWFSLAEPGCGEFGIREDDSGTLFLAKGNSQLLPVKEMLVKGRHNWANALAALALAEAVGLAMETCLTVVKQFGGLPHRCEWVRCYRQVDYFNDSKATNVGATLAALSGLAVSDGHGLIIILGGQGKKQDFCPLFENIGRLASCVVLIGQDATMLQEGLLPHLPVYTAVGMQEAVAKSANLARPGDIVLLSPACASFDMFADYVERGECFKQTVNSLGRVVSTA